jgi:hypothetical protein
VREIGQKPANTVEDRSGVTVRVEHSGFKAISDEKGSYCLDYAPGAFRVLFGKAGYFPHAVPLNLATKTAFPMEDVELQPSPKVVDIFGGSVEGVTIACRTGLDDPRDTGKQTDHDGQLLLEPLEQECEVVLRTEGFRNATFVWNPKDGRYPKEKTIILCPEKFGVYVGSVLIPDSEVVFERAPMDSFAGGAIPRVKAPWEGKYFIRSKPTVLSRSSSTVTFLIYPRTAGRLGPGGDPFESESMIKLLRVGAEGHIAEFGPGEGTYTEVPCNIEPVLQRREQMAGGLASQRIEILKAELALEPGCYAFVSFEKAPLANLFAPGGTGYHFEVK